MAGFRVHKDGEGVGSLLLGLYGDDGRLHHVGVCAAFSAKFRRELIDELGPLTENALDGHPWQGWAEAQADSTQRMPGDRERARTLTTTAGLHLARLAISGDWWGTR